MIEKYIQDNHNQEEGTFLQKLSDGFWDEEKHQELLKILEKYKEAKDKDEETKRSVFQIYRLVVLMINSHCDVNDVFKIKNINRNIDQGEFVYQLEEIVEDILCEK